MRRPDPDLTGELDEASVAAGHDCWCGRHPEECEEAGGCAWTCELDRVRAAGAAAEHERVCDQFRSPVTYMIGLTDGMRKYTGATGDDWQRWLECFRAVRDELVNLLPENDSDPLPPPSPGRTEAIQAQAVAAERERVAAVLRQLAPAVRQVITVASRELGLGDLLAEVLQ